MSTPTSSAPEDPFSSQVLASLQPLSMPRGLIAPSREEAVGRMRPLSRPVLANGEAVGPLQQLTNQPGVRIPRP